MAAANNEVQLVAKEIVAVCERGMNDEDERGSAPANPLGERKLREVLHDLGLGAAHRVEFLVGAHVHEARHPIGKAEERGDGGDVPDIIIRETAFA